MCWIALTKRQFLPSILEDQEDRGLDSLWVMSSNFTYKKVSNAKPVKKLEDYQKYVRRLSDTGLVILHHRKATVGNVTPKNCHPFKGNTFSMFQNGTSKKFYKEYKDVFPAETDSECILKYVESKTNKIEEIPAIIDKMKEETKDIVGILIFTKWNRILFYADWERESWIDINWNGKCLNEIRNYPPNKFMWYKNKGWMILDFHFNIIENNFKDINKEKFITYSNSYVSPSDYSSYYNSGSYWSKWQYTTKTLFNMTNEEKWYYHLFKNHIEENMQVWITPYMDNLEDVLWTWYWAENLIHLGVTEEERIKNGFDIQIFRLAFNHCQQWELV